MAPVLQRHRESLAAGLQPWLHLLIETKVVNLVTKACEQAIGCLSLYIDKGDPSILFWKASTSAAPMPVAPPVMNTSRPLDSDNVQKRPFNTLA